MGENNQEANVAECWMTLSLPDDADPLQGPLASDQDLLGPDALAWVDGAPDFDPRDVEKYTRRYMQSLLQVNNSEPMASSQSTTLGHATQEEEPESTASVLYDAGHVQEHSEDSESDCVEHGTVHHAAGATTHQRPYACFFDECEATFAKRAHLFEHARIHTGERPFRCEIESCGKVFARRGSLTVHVRLHTKERPFTCPAQLCDKAFTTKGQMTIHMRTHSGVKPFKCAFTTCTKFFSQSQHLKRHLAFHERTASSSSQF